MRQTLRPAGSTSTRITFEQIHQMRFILSGFEILQLCRVCFALWFGLLTISGLQASEPAASGTEQLFNGKDLSGWYTYTTETKHENPGVFQVVDGMIYVPGGKGDTAYYGGLITKDRFRNYRLELDYKWGDATYGDRKGKARDAGVLLHCVGPNEPGPWMTSYEFQIIEGGTGDLLLVNMGQGDDQGKGVELTCTAPTEVRGSQRCFSESGEVFTFRDGPRLNWFGRSPGWIDQAGFRGERDVESPFGEWTHCEIVARDDTLEYRVNGKLVNRAKGLSHGEGRILLQTEGAEVWYRNIKLTALDD
jgi:hypothetical protein